MAFESRPRRRPARGDFLPARAGLEVFRPSESTSQPTDAMLDGRTGAVIWRHASCGCDNGRAVAGDIYAGTRLLTGSGVGSNNTTKSTPAVSGDLLGDWREEVVWRLSDSSALRIYSTPTVTDRRITTLMHDAQYRVAVAWQNTAYNQPPHPSFFLGNGMTTQPQSNIYVR